MSQPARTRFEAGVRVRVIKSEGYVSADATVVRAGQFYTSYKLNIGARATIVIPREVMSTVRLDGPGLTMVDIRTDYLAVIDVVDLLAELGEGRTSA